MVVAIDQTRIDSRGLSRKRAAAEQCAGANGRESLEKLPPRGALRWVSGWAIHAVPPFRTRISRGRNGSKRIPRGSLAFRCVASPPSTAQSGNRMRTWMMAPLSIRARRSTSAARNPEPVEGCPELIENRKTFFEFNPELGCRYLHQCFSAPSARRGGCRVRFTRRVSGGFCLKWRKRTGIRIAKSFPLSPGLRRRG